MAAEGPWVTQREFPLWQWPLGTRHFTTKLALLIIAGHRSGHKHLYQHHSQLPQTPALCDQEKPYHLNALLQAQPLPLHLYVHLFPFSQIQLQKPPLFRNNVGFCDYKERTIAVPTRKSIFKKRRELDVQEAESDILVIKESLVWGCRHPELNNCLIPVIHILLHKPGRLYF